MDIIERLFVMPEFGTILRARNLIYIDSPGEAEYSTLDQYKIKWLSCFLFIRRTAFSND